MTGMSEISPIGETTPISPVETAEEMAIAFPDKGDSAQSKSFDFGSTFAEKETPRWENFEGAPKSLADAVKSLGEGMGIGNSEERIVNSEKVRGERYEGEGARDEVRGTRDEVRGTRDDVRGTRDEVRGTRDEVRGTRGEMVVAPEKAKVESDGCLGIVKSEKVRGERYEGEGARKEVRGERDEGKVTSEGAQAASRDVANAPKADGVQPQETVVVMQSPVVQIQSADIRVQAPDAVLQYPRAHLSAAVNAVVETLAVSPALAATGEGEIRIQLKADVLDGSSIKLEAKGGELKITVTPASRAAEETLLKHHESFQSHLAERVVNWRINVGVAALRERYVGNYRTEEES